MKEILKKYFVFNHFWVTSYVTTPVVPISKKILNNNKVVKKLKYLFDGDWRIYFVRLIMYPLNIKTFSHILRNKKAYLVNKIVKVSNISLTLYLQNVIMSLETPFLQGMLCIILSMSQPTWTSWLWRWKSSFKPGRCPNFLTISFHLRINSMGENVRRLTG